MFILPVGLWGLVNKHMEVNVSCSPPPPRFPQTALTGGEREEPKRKAVSVIRLSGSHISLF